MHKLILVLFLLVTPLSLYSGGHEEGKEHGGKEAKSKEHGGKEAKSKEHGGEKAQSNHD